MESTQTSKDQIVKASTDISVRSVLSRVTMNNFMDTHINYLKSVGTCLCNNNNEPCKIGLTSLPSKVNSVDHRVKVAVMTNDLYTGVVIIYTTLVQCLSEKKGSNLELIATESLSLVLK